MTFLGPSHDPQADTRDTPTASAGPALVLLCGVSFSGKSTLGRLIQMDLDAEVMSLDVINAERGLYGGQGIPIAEWQKTHVEARHRAAELLARSRMLLVDDTSPFRFVRDRWRETAAAAGARFALVYLAAPESLVLERLRSNRSRPRRPDVSDDVMRQHVADFQPPEQDEPHVLVDATGYDVAGTLAAIRSAVS